MTNLTGKVLASRYRVIESLGSGGMAEVYKVWDQHRAAYLALKMMHQDLAEDPVFFRRFQNEAQTMKNLEHPNIVRFFGIEKDAGNVFILMEFIEGVTLQKVLNHHNRHPLSIDYIGKIMLALCSALHYAHHLKMVHCDIKPANIMINEAGRVLLTDFGIARFADSAISGAAMAGTPTYMAPELIQGYPPTNQSDIYALGIVLYEMVSGGEKPFTGSAAQIPGLISEKVRWEQVNLPPPPPRRYTPQISPALQNVTLTCLRKSPEERFQNVSDLWNAIVHATGVEPSEAQPDAMIVEIPPLIPADSPKRDQDAHLPESNSVKHKTRRIITNLLLISVPLILSTLMVINGFQGRGLLKSLAEKTPQSTPLTAERQLPMAPPAAFSNIRLPFTATATTISITDTPRYLVASTTQATQANALIANPTPIRSKTPAILSPATASPSTNLMTLTVANQHCYPVDILVDGEQKIAGLAGYGKTTTLSLPLGTYTLEYCEIYSPDCIRKVLTLQSDETLVISKEPRCPSTENSPITIQVNNYDCYDYDIYIGGNFAMSISAGAASEVAWQQGVYDVNICHANTTSGCSDVIYPIFSDDLWELPRQTGCSN